MFAKQVLTILELAIRRNNWYWNRKEVDDMPFITPTFKNISEEAIQEYDIDAESQALLDDGHKKILQSECSEDYGYP